MSANGIINFTYNVSGEHLPVILLCCEINGLIILYCVPDNILQLRFCALNPWQKLAFDYFEAMAVGLLSLIIIHFQTLYLFLLNSAQDHIFRIALKRFHFYSTAILNSVHICHNRLSLVPYC